MKKGQRSLPTKKSGGSKNGFNGIFYDGKIENLATIITGLDKDPELVHRMSQNAQNYYFDNRQHQFMIRELCNSVNYALANISLK